MATGPSSPSANPSSSLNTNERPRRLLSIDGGGLLGLIPAEALILVEKQLNDMTGEKKRLCERFDLIGGTSTGAILAAGLALGLGAEELRDFYLNYGKEIFTKCFWPVRFWHGYPSTPLEFRLKKVFGESTTLGDAKVKTQILIVTKNATLGNDWFFTNNRNSKFYANNAGLPLWQVVRASTAAPTYFPPQPITICDETGTKHTYEFVDGGVSSYNNPAMQVLLEAITPGYGFNWPTGVDRLLLMSLGTGFNAITIDQGKASRYNLLDWAKYIVKELMNEANLQQNVLMGLIGQRPADARSESAEMTVSGAVKDAPSEASLQVVRDNLAGQKLMTYQRITIGLTKKRLTDLRLGQIDPIKVREMDAADQIQNMKKVGEAVANEQVHMEELIQFFKD